MYSDCQYFYMKQDAKRALDNYRQDCFVRHHYGTCYQGYMDKLIGLLTDTQQTVDRHYDVQSDANGNHKKVQYHSQNTHVANLNIDQDELGSNWQGPLGPEKITPIRTGVIFHYSLLNSNLLALIGRALTLLTLTTT